MSPTTSSGLTFYEEEAETGLWLGLTQFSNAFNANSGGTIVLQTGARKGYIPAHTVMDDISGLIQSRDPSATGNKTPVNFANSEHKAIKVFSTSPLVFRRQDWIDSGLDSATGTRLFFEMLGQAQAQQYLNSALSALVGSIGAIGTTAIHDISGSKNADYTELNIAMGLMGDRRQGIRGLAMYSTALRDLIGEAYASQQIAFQVGGVTINNGSIPTMGLRQIVTDAPPLTIVNTGADFYWSLLLVPSAVIIKTGPSHSVFEFQPGTPTSTPDPRPTDPGWRKPGGSGLAAIWWLASVIP